MFESKVSLINTTVKGNTATGATIDGCQFDVVHSCAGGIWNFHGTLSLQDSTVKDNFADGNTIPVKPATASRNCRACDARRCFPEHR